MTTKEPTTIDAVKAQIEWLGNQVRQLTEENKRLRSWLMGVAEYAVESGIAREIDSGCGGDGDIANILQFFGDSYEEANQKIWGEEWEKDEWPNSDEEDKALSQDNKTGDV